MSTAAVPLIIAADHPAFAGHFPGHPLAPGVLLLDLAQRAIERMEQVRLVGIAAAKFLSPVVPGECPQLRYQVSNSQVSFTICVGDRVAAKGQFLLATAEGAL